MVDFEFSAVYDERKGTYLIEDEEKIAQILKTFEKCRSFSIVPKKPSYELTPAPTTGIEIYWQYKDGKQKRSDNELVRFSIGVPEKRTGSSYPERAYVQVPDSSPFGKRHAVKSWNGRIPIVMNQEDSKKIWKVVGLPDVDFYRVPFNRR